MYTKDLGISHLSHYSSQSHFSPCRSTHLGSRDSNEMVPMLCMGQLCHIPFVTRCKGQDHYGYQNGHFRSRARNLMLPPTDKMTVIRLELRDKIKKIWLMIKSWIYDGKYRNWKIFLTVNYSFFLKVKRLQEQLLRVSKFSWRMN